LRIIVDDAILPTSHATAHKYIINHYEASKPTLAVALSKAWSSIYISFDGLHADNPLDMLSITAYYLDEQPRMKTVLLELKTSVCKLTPVQQFRRVASDYACGSR